MAKVIFNRREIKLWYGHDKKLIKKIADALDLLAGHLGGHGIDLVSEAGAGLSYDEYHFQYDAPLEKFKIGARVKTADEISQRDFSKEAMKYRRTNTIGTVVREHNSHGLCYDVYHDADGTIGCYDPDELVDLNQ